MTISDMFSQKSLSASRPKFVFPFEYFPFLFLFLYSPFIPPSAWRRFYLFGVKVLFRYLAILLDT